MKSPLKSFVFDSIVLRVMFKASLPASIVAEETSQVYLGAPMMNTFTSYPFSFEASIPACRALLMAWMPSKERQDMLKLAIVLTIGRLNRLFSSSIRFCLTA